MCYLYVLLYYGILLEYLYESVALYTVFLTNKNYVPKKSFSHGLKFSIITGFINRSNNKLRISNEI